MSWELMLAARHWDVTPTARHVAMVIASHANRAGLAWPSLETIATETGRSRRGVVYAVRELEDAGHVTVVARTGQASEYVFASYPQIVRKHPANCGAPLQIATEPLQNATPQLGRRTYKEESGLSTDDLTPAAQIPANVADIRSGLRRHA
jgi:DNA-binding transcriptional MocR family regulator